MVLGEEFDAPRPYAVDPTVAHMTDGGEAVLVVKEDRRYRRPHSPQARLLVAGVEHFTIRLLYGDAETAPSHRAPSARVGHRGQFLVLGCLDREPHRLYRQSAGHRPADMPSHSVRYDIQGLGGEKSDRVFVCLAHSASVGFCSAADWHGTLLSGAKT